MVGLNHGSSIYFYNSIDLLQQKISSGYKFFREKLQFDDDEILLDISARPIISSQGFFKLFKDHNQMKVLINNIEDLDETIKYDIKEHKISFLLSNGSSNATVDKIMRYLSSNPIYESISNTYVQETLNKIEESNKTITQINKLVEKYSIKTMKMPETLKLYVDGQNENVSDMLSLSNQDLLISIVQSKMDLILETCICFRFDEEAALIS